MGDVCLFSEGTRLCRGVCSIPLDSPELGEFYPVEKLEVLQRFWNLDQDPAEQVLFVTHARMGSTDPEVHQREKLSTPQHRFSIIYPHSLTPCIPILVFVGPFFRFPSHPRSSTASNKWYLCLAPLQPKHVELARRVQSPTLPDLLLNLLRAYILSLIS